MALFDPKAKAIAQLQRSTEEKTASINRYFDEIGRLYYGQYRDTAADVSKDINSRCDAITALLTDIEGNKLKILFEKGLKLCSQCKKENPLEHSFCSACGAKFPEGSDKQVELPTTPPAVPAAAPVQTAAPVPIETAPAQEQKEAEASAAAPVISASAADGVQAEVPETEAPHTSADQSAEPETKE